MRLAHYLLLHLLFLSKLVFYSAQVYVQSQNCAPFSCGWLGVLGYPFFRNKHPRCGMISTNCTAPSEPKAQFLEKGKWYPINSVDYLLRRIEIHDEDVQSHLMSNSCNLLKNFSEEAHLMTFSQQMPPFFLSFKISKTRPFFKCKHKPKFSSTFFDKFDHYNCTGYDLLYYKNQQEQLPSLPGNLSNSSVVHLPPTGVPDYDTSVVKDSLTLHWGANFALNWEILPGCFQCLKKGGECHTMNKRFKCSIDKDESGKKGAKIGRRVAIGASGVTILGLTLYFKVNYKRKKSRKPKFSGGIATTNLFEEFIKNQGSFSPKRYNFKEIKKMTCTFKNELGHGGYGSVFKGVLNDGKFVTVKVLSEVKGNEEEFINEVASISRNSHVNIVSLLGYCFDGSKRALVYEFMPNGSLEKYIYDKDSLVEYTNLGWATLHDISVGIARGLEYLHRGCNTRILHFDIKPHNILIDEDFCPKISDFGLAKFCPRKDSVLSMLGTRGTVRYIAPEIFCGNFGGISHKSNVYNYGMMILEMVGGRKNIAIDVNRTSEIYFPHWIHKRIELNEDLRLHGIVSEAQENILRKMILVGLWCIQTNPFDRPAMSRVLEMLEGSLEFLEIPPKPSLSSPSRLQGGSSIN